MSWFKPSKQDEKIIGLLKKSSGEFRFDPRSVKFRLLSSIEHLDQKPVRHFRFSRVAMYATSFASLVILISTTFAFASSSRPGDKLFALNKFGEQMVLKLPLSVEQKAKVQEHIVSNRLEALDQVQSRDQLQTVRESDETLMSAVDNITATKKRLEDSGKTQDAEKLEKVLDQLQSQAQKKEALIKEWGDKTEDTETKTQIRNHLRKIEASREKAKSQIRRFNNDNSDNSGKN